MSSMLDQTSLYTFIETYLGVILTITLIVTILRIIAMWKVFTKANEKGWKAIIPIYNMITYYKISGVTPWLYLITILASILSVVSNTTIVSIALLVTIIITIYQTSNLAKSFGKGIGYTLGLLFLNTIFLYIIGFGNVTYQNKKD